VVVAALQDRAANGNRKQNVPGLAAS